MQIVIVGGGAGGLELACRLGRKYKSRSEVNIVLVDHAPAHLWKPLLHEVAAGTLSSSDDEMSYLAQARWQHFQFRLGPLVALDRAGKQIRIGATAGPDGEIYLPESTLAYDILVIAIGSVSNDFQVPGVSEQCFFLDSPAQADRFNQHLLRTCHSANASPEQRASQLHFAIAGGGATGVELAAELHFAVHSLVEYGLVNIDIARDLRIHIVEAADRLLPGLPQKISDGTQRALIEMGIAVHTGQTITHADAHAFHTASGQTIAAETKIWAAGIKGPEVLNTLDGLKCTKRNQLEVGADLRCVNDEHIFALGDCASLVSTDSPAVPPRAQAAHQQATLMAANIARLLDGKPLKNYRYRDFGSLISLSRNSAVGSLMGNLANRHYVSFPLEGKLAGLAYMSLYKMHQLAIHGWIRTLLATLANVLTRAKKPHLKLH